MSTSHSPVASKAKPQAARPDRQSLDSHERDFYTAFKRDHPFVWLGTLIGPPIISIVLLIVLFLMEGGEFVQKLVLTALGTFFFFGKFVILGGEDATQVSAGFLTRESLFALVVFMDLMTATLLVFHAGFLFRIPLLGPKLLALAEDGKFMLQLHPWMRRATFVGIVAFVMFPLAATGSIGGAIFGRLLGMSRVSAFVGIAIGSVLGCSLMYFGAGLVNKYLDRNNPIHMFGGAAAIAAIIFLLNYRYRQIKKRRMEANT